MNLNLKKWERDKSEVGKYIYLRVRTMSLVMSAGQTTLLVWTQTETLFSLLNAFIKDSSSYHGEGEGENKAAKFKIGEGWEGTL